MLGSSSSSSTLPRYINSATGANCRCHLASHLCQAVWQKVQKSRLPPSLLGRQRTHACGHNASRRVKFATTTSATNHHHGRTAPVHDEDDGQGSRYFAQNPPALASSSRKALHLKALGLLCGALFLGHACTTLHGRPCGSEKDRVAQDQLHTSQLIALSLTYHPKLLLRFVPDGGTGEQVIARARTFMVWGHMCDG